jgi:hypothetical protein
MVDSWLWDQPAKLDFARKKCEHFNLQVNITHS